jgi:glycosyltransferase involved in cell wall biosynthesis
MEPRFSVLVPVYEQWDLVPKLLACLAAQTLPQDRFEVILADNGSRNFTPPATLPANVRIMTCAQPGSYAARNAAAAEAKGEWFAFTDADCLAAPGWLAALDAAATDQNTILIGAVDMRASGTTPNAYEAFDIVKGIPQEHYVRLGYGATANLAVTAELFRRVDGFDSARLSGGDAEFCRRASAKAGATVRYVAAARVGHPARATWEEIATKSRRMIGGQVLAGSAARRAYRVLRILAPPLIRCAQIVLSDKVSPGQRWGAVGVQIRVWASGVAELVRLLAGGTAERR